MWQGLLKFGLYGLGISAILIGSSIALLGSDAVANFFNGLVAIIHDDGPITDMATPNIDSELRFYSVMFVFYGVLLLGATRNFDQYFSKIPLLLSVFFLAGIARFIGYVMIGKPQALFFGLMIIELGLPILLGLFWVLHRRRRN